MQYSKLDKEYEATFRLGEVSSTGDPEGDITHVSDDIPSIDAIKAALEPFRGEITQTPPMFSAIKINGRRAYDMARKGEVVEMPSRQVTVHSLELLDYSYPNVRVRAHVSSGTYIRSLAEDIGKLLKTGAYCSELRRTKVAEWSVADATPIEK